MLLVQHSLKLFKQSFAQGQTFRVCQSTFVPGNVLEPLDDGVVLLIELLEGLLEFALEWFRGLTEEPRASGTVGEPIH